MLLEDLIRGMLVHPVRIVPHAKDWIASDCVKIYHFIGVADVSDPRVEALKRGATERVRAGVRKRQSKPS
jgi:hypothetical protein